MSVKLGVNIDHVATLRQARKETEPDPVAAARVARSAGADIIVCHLRQDRRHIQEADLKGLSKLKVPLHVECSVDPGMLRVVEKIKPNSVCLVPERAGEISTEGGMNMRGATLKAIERATKRLGKMGIGVSHFVDPDAGAIRAARAAGTDVVELCTLKYAEAWGKRAQDKELERIELATYLADEMELEVHAGHGLDYHNVRPIARIPNMAALNIGFSIIARSVFVGLKPAVSEMKNLCRGR